MVLTRILTLDTEKTTLAGRFSREINCTPKWTDEARHIWKTMNDDAMKPTVSTSIVKSFDPRGVIHAGAHMRDNFSDFVVSIWFNGLQGRANSDSARLPNRRRTRSRRKRRLLDYRRASCVTASFSATTNMPTGLSKHSSRLCFSLRHGYVRIWKSLRYCISLVPSQTFGN